MAEQKFAGCWPRKSPVIDALWGLPVEPDTVVILPPKLSGPTVAETTTQPPVRDVTTMMGTTVTTMMPSSTTEALPGTAGPQASSSGVPTAVPVAVTLAAVCACLALAYIIVARRSKRQVRAKSERGFAVPTHCLNEVNKSAGGGGGNLCENAKCSRRGLQLYASSQPNLFSFFSVPHPPCSDLVCRSFRNALRAFRRRQ